MLFKTTFPIIYISKVKNLTNLQENFEIYSRYVFLNFLVTVPKKITSLFP